MMNKHWVHVSELKEYYKYSLENNEFRGNFEEYVNYFLDSMVRIGLPHTIINGDVAQG